MTDLPIVVMFVIIITTSSKPQLGKNTKTSDNNSPSSEQ